MSFVLPGIIVTIAELDTKQSAFQLITKKSFYCLKILLNSLEMGV